MEILKYLDILIGLAVVMVLLSPVVSAMTQFWLWLFNARAGRLQVGIKHLLLQLGSNTYEIFDKAVVIGAPGSVLNGDGFADGVGKQVGGNTEYSDNIPGRLRKGKGNLTFVPALPLPTHVSLQGDSRIGEWKLTTPATDANGIAKAAYNYLGRPELASRDATIDIPGGSTVDIKIASGPHCGTPLKINVGPTVTVSYPDNIKPVPASHDLEIQLRSATTVGNVPTGTPLAGGRVTFTFSRNTALDRTMPATGLPAAASLSPAQAEEIAREVLLHPMVVQPPFWGKFCYMLRWLPSRISLCKSYPPEQSRRRGEVIEREELIRILLEFAAGEGGGGRDLEPDTLKTWRSVLDENDLPNPAVALAGIRRVAQELEATQPELATHVRMTKAIVGAASSSFVGKVNNWFDQTMDRTTAEYKFRAQLVTVFFALVVAMLVQMDSLDFLRRLSTDGSLRASLVERARDVEKRIDDQSANKNRDADELALAKARREEIESNLATLRDPQLAVLPDHFIWDSTPRARLMDSEWAHPYSKRLELVIGTSVFPLEPQWSSDPLTDIRSAIESSGAPVHAEIENHLHRHVTVTGDPDIIPILHICALVKKVEANREEAESCDGKDLITHISGFAEAALGPNPAVPQRATLLVGNDAPLDVVTKAGSGWSDQISKSNAAVTVVPPSAVMPNGALKATRPDIRWIELRKRATDPESNLLSATIFVEGKALIDDMAFPAHAGPKGCLMEVQSARFAFGSGTVLSGPWSGYSYTPGFDPDRRYALRLNCDVDAALAALDTAASKLPARSLVVSDKSVDHLVVTSSRLGALQLRAIPGKPDTDMFNRYRESVVDWRLLESWRGVLLTWVLLSLGAPFWYDALKNLLNLRTTAAQKEEKARTDRQTENPTPKPAERQ